MFTQHYLYIILPIKHLNNSQNTDKMGKSESIQTEIELYLSSFNGEALEKLCIIREIIKHEVPDASESKSYGLIGYRLNGKPLVYFGGFKNHIGLYATPAGHEAFKDDFAPYKQRKGSVQFPLDMPLPKALIRRVVRFRKDTIQKAYARAYCNNK